jgi:hypothetical protein
VQIVSFDQADAGAVVFAAEDGGVAAWRGGRFDRRFLGVDRGQFVGLDGGFLRILPIVVEDKDGAVAVVQFQGRILERVGDPGAA